MGNKESRPVSIPYEEAAKRVTDAELQRLKETFRKVCPGQQMTRDIFSRELFGDAIPQAVADQIFEAFGGTGGTLSFKELVAGLVLFTRGKDATDEKIKFLFGLYADDNMMIQKERIDAAVLATDGDIPESLSELFEHSDKVDYYAFKNWLTQYPEFSSISYWLLMEPSANKLTVAGESKSFYQTLAGVTHLTEPEIVHLELKYNALKNTSGSGRFDLDLLRRLVSPPMARQLVDTLYRAFDENQDGHIDIKEMICGISACCRGPSVERQKFCFRIFDLDHDGYLSKTELVGAIEASITVLQQSEHADSFADLLEMDAYTMANEIIQSHGNVKEGKLGLEDYLLWAEQSKIPQGFADLLFEICHVIFGLKPSTWREEGKVVKGWLSREQKRGYSLGQTWYLVSQNWWKKWLDYVSDDVVLEALELDSHYDIVQTTNYSHYRRPNESRGSEELKIHPPRPGPILNHSLLQNHGSSIKLSNWTNDGGVLKNNLEEGKDFQLLPEQLWLAMHSWYQGEPQLPRPVIIPKDSTEKSAVVELYQCTVKLHRHQTTSQQLPQNIPTNLAGVTNGLANMALQMTGLQSSSVKRSFISTATFSYHHSLRQITDFLSSRLRVPKDDLRLWKYNSENDLELLEGEESIVADLGITSGQSLLMEVRNPDLSWPEEMLQMLNSKGAAGNKHVSDTTVECGATGLSNLGNTCFMNSAIQCVSNTQPLTRYFLKKYHRYELNKTNPLGMQGRLAWLYGELISNLWNGKSKSILPVELRYTLAKYAPQFNGSLQHDSQELLAFLLDGLHEDLNRVQQKPYVELKDSDGRKDDIVAKEGWDYHLLRNQSIIVDLFHGQLKSLVKCKQCSHTSVRFDPFNYLSLPLPMESCLLMEVVLLRRNGEVPERFAVRLDSEDKYSAVKEKLAEYSGIPAANLLLTELSGPFIKSFPFDNQKIRRRGGSYNPIYAYEMEITVVREIPVAQKETNGQINQNGKVPNGKPANGTVNKQPMGTLVQNKSETLAMVKVNNNNGTLESLHSDVSPPDGLVIAVHRKTERRELYFLASQQSVPLMFGTPIVIQVNKTMTHRDLYHQIWKMIERFVTGHPVTEHCNHAQDCDGSLGNEYPFELKATKRNGSHCSCCPYYRFCKGCPIEYTDELFDFKSTFLAIDWDPTAYYLRYQTSAEKVHESVNESYDSADKPISISDCLEAFTKEEELSDEELYYCSKCKKHQLATKKLEIWRLPPILIIHLKRFQFVNNRWIKSQKSVDFKLHDFDPESYLVPRSTVATPEPAYADRLSAFNAGDNSCTPSQSVASMCNYLEASGNESNHLTELQSARRTKTISTTSVDSLDYSQTKYDLYALSTHRGVLGGGHYVAYTKNPNGKWYEYNDSMVKEVSENSITQTNKKNSYILFYERQYLDYSRLMPDISNKNMEDLDEAYSAELKKGFASCLIQ